MARYSSSDYKQEHDLYEELKNHKKTRNIERREENYMKRYREGYYYEDSYEEDEVYSYEN